MEKLSVKTVACTTMVYLRKPLSLYSLSTTWEPERRKYLKVSGHSVTIRENRRRIFSF